jgi:uncharacterized protein (DUF1778 family)
MAVTGKIQRYEVQWDTETHALAERAAAAAGYSSIKAYLGQLVREDAARVLSQQQQVKLTHTQFEHFARLCETTQTPGEKLKQAARDLDTKGFDLDAQGR